MPELLKVPALTVESNLINIVTFIVFDVFLISAVFHLTSDIMGRLNDAALRDGQSRRLFIVCPPLLGGGLCSTNRRHSHLLLMVRLLGVVYILMANLSIIGRSQTIFNIKRANVTVEGTLRNITKERFADAVLTRTACFGNRNIDLLANGTKEIASFYGEIRGDDCVSDFRMLSKPPIYFATRIVNVNMTSGACPYYRKRKHNGIEAAEFFCESATLQCRFVFEVPDLVDLDTCRGVLQRGSETFITEEGAPWPGMPFEKTEARMVRGLDYRDRKWLDALFVNQDSIVDGIHALYGSAVEERNVRVMKEELYTFINPLWFAAVALKVLLVTVLAIISFFLIHAGFRTMLHDEQHLAELLRQSLEENDPRLTRVDHKRPNIYLAADCPCEGGMVVYAAGIPEISWEAMQQQLYPNMQLHLDEAQFY